MAFRPACATIFAVAAETSTTRSAAETEAVAAQFAVHLEPGDVVLLGGELGSGKTAFVRGACAALGVTAPVTSPSYVLGQIYPGSPEVAHLDLYRLESIAFADELALEDYLTPQRIGFVEWPHDGELAGARVRARVTLEHAGGDERRITTEWVA